jgi:hypothetical protein
MRDNLLKFRILWIGLRVAFDEWRNEVWNKDLDGYYCCNGNECGCYAMTRRELHTDLMKKSS